MCVRLYLRHLPSAAQSMCAQSMCMLEGALQCGTRGGEHALAFRPWAPSPQVMPLAVTTMVPSRMQSDDAVAVKRWTGRVGLALHPGRFRPAGQAPRAYAGQAPRSDPEARAIGRGRGPEERILPCCPRRRGPGPSARDSESVCARADDAALCNESRPRRVTARGRCWMRAEGR